MIRLAQTAKEFWMNNADKFLNNEIEWEIIQQCLMKTDKQF
jgi:hypothetical protein